MFNLEYSQRLLAFVADAYAIVLVATRAYFLSDGSRGFA